MIKFALIPVVVFSAAGAQVLMKYAINLVLLDKLPMMILFKTWHIYISVGLYVLAFAATIYLFSVFELSFISPVLVGGVMMLIFVAGIFLGETMTIMRFSGVMLLISGIFLLAYSR